MSPGLRRNSKTIAGLVTARSRLNRVRETWSADRKTKTVFEGDLHEVSPVALPAYPQTSVAVAESLTRSASVSARRANGPGYQSPEQRRAAARKAWAQSVSDAPCEAARRAAIIAEHQRRIRERSDRWAHASSSVSLRGF